MTYAYVPIGLGSKKPLLPNWNLKENCITSKADSHKLAGNNIGIAHAYCDPVTCCIDIDNATTALPILNINPKDLQAPICESGRENSLKLFFTLKAPLESIPIEVDGKVSFEYRCATKTGLTVSDCIPPSLHPSGTKYRWVNNLTLVDAPELPEELLNDWHQRIAAKSEKKHATVRARSFDFACDSPADEALLRKLLSYIDPNCDRATWVQVIFSILSTELTNAVPIAQSWSEGSPDQFNLNDFNSTINSYRAGHYSTGTLYYYAKRGGYLGSRRK
jgi:hypothetical protein